MEERLQKFLAQAGVASRRKAETIILEGRVSVNNVVVNELGTKVNPAVDFVQVDGKHVKKADENIYILLNKPTGYVTTTKDQFDRQSVIDLVGDFKTRLYPVGRLDYHTSGLLILTNDGDLTYRVTHPKHEMNKTYLATIDKILSPSAISRLRNGVMIEQRKTSKAEVKVIDTKEASQVIQVKIHEGRNRQVRKMFEAVGANVEKLDRIAIGKIKKDDLGLGKYRLLTKEEINYLKHS